MLEPGQSFQGYTIVKSLGNRRVIQNYQAKLMSSGASVRLTLLADDLFPEFADRKAFLASAKNICAIEQEGLARVMDIAEGDGQVYYVSDFYPGGNFKRILGKKLPAGQALRILRDLVQALEPLHEAGLPHGNVKPGNILLGKDGRPTLTDVGVSSLLKLDYSLGIDPYFVSPEQVRGGQPITASDIYSLGIGLYQMLCGKLPFQADSDFRIALLRLDEPLPKLSADYALIQPLLDSMLNLDPQERPTCSEILEALEALIIEADALGVIPEKLEQENGEAGMEELPTQGPDVGIAKKIEQTLNEKEQQRLNEEPVSIEITEPERSSAGSYFNYLMLLLGLLVGAVVGAAFYFILPSPGTSGSAEQSVVVQEAQPRSTADDLLAKGKIAEAKSAYVKLIASNPVSPRPYNNLASIYAAEGDLEQAQVLLKKALETNPDYLSIYRNIGTVYAAMARDSYGKALQLEGSTQVVRLQYLDVRPPEVLVATTIMPKEETAPETKTSTVETAAVSTTPAAVDTNSVSAEELAPTVETASEVTPQVVKTPVVESVPVETVTPVPGTPAPGQKDASMSPQEFLRSWAKAWSSQDVAAYLASYAPEFVPANGSSRTAWENKRRKRLKSPSFIEVKLETVEAISGTADTAELRLIQGYRSDRYEDRTRKSFLLRRDGTSWLIAQERSLGRVE